ncbi:hypothetical protein [Streptacidiphilus sp. EB129]|uniref:hypothetical protein n=1 Tax=Streptacidiphilus sp. EB129 TaxID=3156262 RepID=UPI0035142625
MPVIGLAVLYAAFAVVALWLLGELLLQHRAQPHWRVLALLGFLVLVAGVAQRSLPLIGAGVVAFGAGQALVTRAVKNAYGSHWSLRSADGSLPGALARVPLLGTVFPAGQVTEAGEAASAPQVGEVGPVEDVPQSAAPAVSQPEYATAAFEAVESGGYESAEHGGQQYPQQYAGYGDGSAVGSGGAGNDGGGYGGYPAEQQQGYSYDYAQTTAASPYYEQQSQQQPVYEGSSGYYEPQYQSPQHQTPQYQDGQYQQQSYQQPYQQSYDHQQWSPAPADPAQQYQPQQSPEEYPQEQQHQPHQQAGNHQPQQETWQQYR